MKFIHTSDWHLGRRLGEHALIDDQRVFCDWPVEAGRVAWRRFDRFSYGVAQGRAAPGEATPSVGASTCSG